MGKGSSRRKENFKAIQDNWGLIDWKNERRDKVQKMFGVETNEPSCFNCRGEGRILEPHEGQFDRWVICSICEGKKTLPLGIWKEKLDAQLAKYNSP